MKYLSFLLGLIIGWVFLSVQINLLHASYYLYSRWYSVDRRLSNRSSSFQVELGNDDGNLCKPASRSESVALFRLTNFSDPVYCNNNCYSDPLLFYLPSWKDQFYRVQKCYSDNYHDELPPLAAKVAVSDPYIFCNGFSVELLILIILSTIMEEFLGRMVLTCVSTSEQQWLMYSLHLETHILYQIDFRSFSIDGDSAIRIFLFRWIIPTIQSLEGMAVGWSFLVG